MQKCFSHYYRGGSLYVRKTNTKLDGSRMLKLRVLARKKMKIELMKEEQKEKEKARRLQRKVRVKKRPSSSNAKKRSRRTKVDDNIGLRPMTR